MATGKKHGAAKRSLTRAPAPDTHKVILCYQIHSAPLKPSQSTNPSEEIWRRHNSASGLHQVSANPHACARKEVRLPFVPFLGLRLDTAYVDGGVPIVMVTWRVDGLKSKSASDLSAGYFLCTYEDQYPEGRATYEKLKESAIRSDWEVKEFGSP
jgi:hypothetical protein